MGDVSEEVLLKEEFTVWGGVKHIVSFAVPMSLSQMSLSVISMVTVFFAGKIGIAELGAAALSMSFINATSFSVAAGFCGALETFFSHSYGDNPDSKKYGTYAQRMIFILLLLSFPIAALFSYCEPLMLAVGQTPTIAKNVAIFTQIGLIGLLPSMLLEVAKRYFQSQHLTVPVTVATAVGAFIVNPLGIVLFLYGFDLGYASLPLAWCLLQVSMFVGLIAYAKYSGLVERTWAGFDRDAFTHWSPMLKLGFLSFLMMVSEFITIEVNNMSAGYEDEVSLAAFSITVQIAFFAWNVTAGVYGTMSVLIGTYVGAGQPMKGRSYAVLGSGVVIVVAIFNVAWMFFFGDAIAAAYTDSEEVRAVFKQIMPCLMAFHSVDAFQSNALSIMRGCGMQRRGALAVGISYAVIGVPLGWFMCFYMGWGVGMLWLGPAIGCFVGGWPFYLHAIFVKDWSTMASNEASTAKGSGAADAAADGVQKTVEDGIDYA